MSNPSPESTFVELLDGLHIAMFTTRGTDGTLRSIPMARQEVDASAELWFITARDTEHVRDVRTDPNVLLTFAGGGTWVALTGKAAVVDDLDKLKELWSTFAEAWLPEGPEGENSALIRVDVDTAEYWDSPGGRTASVLSLVKSKLTGETYDSTHDTIHPG
ncbi:pyridoxamine 5'-phosphate oxidase family protein [Aeromicrobium sp. CF4.19]|uniref:pyridoxamine 5'-phosphate oxidase family protein n=1 Tax=Aeromicrobium sp. CF4.19 TaxID=3373082 RepID=UPI003EE7DFFE